MKITLPFGWSQNKLLLVAGNVLLGVVLIVLGNAHVLPLDPVNFLFFSFVAFLFALYRPGWAFLFFVGLIPYETVNLAPEAWGIGLRPYQWLAFLLFAAILLRLAVKKLPFDLVRPRWFDWLLLLIPVGAFLAAVNAPVPGAAVKQAVIVLSFGLVYATGRIFWQSIEDVKQSVPFAFSSALVVFGYALWQNLAFLAGRESFQVMAGRPNSTFSEADWLGLFVVVVLSVIYALMYQVFCSKEQKGIRNQESGIKNYLQNTKAYLIAFFLVITFIILIITVARSAWLGAVAAAIVMGALILYRRGVKSAAIFTGVVTGTFVVALGLVWGLSLTSFQLGNRVQSVGSGLQRITVSCDRDIVLPERIGTIDELVPLGCRHIDLEDIEAERSAGHVVKETSRDDPNVSIRQEIYAKVWGLVREHPIFGIGFGSAAAFLGSDERGAGLNASNMFLEIWLGSGLVGLVAFAVFWLAVGISSILSCIRSGLTGDETLPFFVLSAWVGITVFNLFNSGVLLGFFFLYLALGALVLERKENI